MHATTSAKAPSGGLRRNLLLAASTVVGITVALCGGERWLTTRALAKATARVAALDIRVGGPDFASHRTSSPGRDADAWLKAIVNARSSDLLSLSSVAATEGLRVDWTARLAGWDPRDGMPEDRLGGTFFALRQALEAAVDAELAAGRPDVALEHLRAMAHTTAFLLDGTQAEAMQGVWSCKSLAARLESLAQAGMPTGDTESRAALVVTLANLRPFEGLVSATRRDAALSLAVVDAAFTAEPRAYVFGLVTAARTHTALAANEYWAGIGEALADPDPLRRSAVLEVIDGMQRASPPWSHVQLFPSARYNLAYLLQLAQECQDRIDTFCALHGAVR